MNARIFRNEDASIREYGEVLRFWSNGIGELHDPNKGDIGYEGLPEELKRVYDELYWEPTGGASLRYFVQTDKGYGIALLNEYDTVTAESSGVDFGPLFETVVEDARNIGLDPAFENCEVFAGECLGFDGCHEIVVVFPWNTPSAAFVEAAKHLDELVYCACGINKPRKDAAQDKGERGEDKGEVPPEATDLDNVYKPREISKEQADLIAKFMFESESSHPRLSESGFDFLNHSGKYFLLDEGKWIGLDYSSDYEGYVEEFEDKEECVAWLNHEFEIKGIQDWRDRQVFSQSLDETLGQAKEESVWMVTESVVGIGDFVEDGKMKRGLDKAAVLRSKALEACSKVPGYEKLPWEDKNALYDLVRSAVERDLDMDLGI